MWSESRWRCAEWSSPPPGGPQGFHSIAAHHILLKRGQLGPKSWASGSQHVNFISLCLSFFIYKMKTKTRPCVDYWDGRGDAEGCECSSAEPGAKQARLGRIHSSLPGQQCPHSILQRA